MMTMRFVLSLLTVFVLYAPMTVAQDSFEVFQTKSESDIPYRIPAIAALPDGTVISVADYRYSRMDIGMVEDGRIDLHVRVSGDGGCSWGDIRTLIAGKGNESEDFMNVAFGDPCIVADRKTGKLLLISCAGNISFPKGLRGRHLGIVCFYSNDGGLTWSAPKDVSEPIYEQFDRKKPVRSMFIASGKIHQSRYVKKGRYYRLYCSVLVQENAKNRMNHVLYSDDFGQTWSVLGGVETAPIPTGADEAKVEELPGGDILISSRTRKGGRMFNIFSFSNKRKATGEWAEMAHSSSHNNGIVTEDNDCNGELLLVPVIRAEDGRKVSLLLQSAPMGPERTNVGIYYKTLKSSEDYSSPKQIAENWEGVYQVTDKGSAYSTMIMLPDGMVGFLFEEETYCTTTGGGYTIVYERLDVKDITDGKFTASKARL